MGTLWADLTISTAHLLGFPHTTSLEFIEQGLETFLMTSAV